MTTPKTASARPLFPRAGAIGLALCAAAAQAHDTWFEARPADPLLRLGTGNQFPLRETAVGPEYLVRNGCHATDGRERAPLAVETLEPAALALRAPAGASGCYIQMTPFTLTLDPALVPVYLQEVRPPQATLDIWSAMNRRGLPWRERYTKHARIALQPGPTPAAEPALGLDALIEADDADGLLLRVLRDGRPLPGFAVELRHESTAFGFWRQTDAEGRLRFKPTLAGAWLLRGIDLRLSDSEPGSWDSRFVTLAFQARPR